MSVKLQRRYMASRQHEGITALEIRAGDKPAEGSVGTIRGYASVFNARSELMELWSGACFYEVIKPGAFARSLASHDIRALSHHETTAVIGRSSAKTLRIREDEKGLYYEVDLPDTTHGRDLLASILRGDIDASSFAMSEVTDTWRRECTQNGVAIFVREITDLRLWEVSPVTWPAYSASSVSARAMGIDGDELADMVKRAKASDRGEAGSQRPALARARRMLLESMLGHGG